jgi:hypothetical protein
MAPEALIALDFRGHSFDDPFHATSGASAKAVRLNLVLGVVSRLRAPFLHR